MKKIIIIFVSTALLLLLSFLIFGAPIDIVLHQDKLSNLFTDLRSIGWLIGIFLLVSDILLPVPATGVMAALGHVYGLWWGALFSAIGSICAGLLGYGIARFLDRKYSFMIVSSKDVKNFKIFFDSWGGYAVIISRLLPVMPELVAIMAGFARMKFNLFLSALIVGSIFVSIFFVSLGLYSNIIPGIGIIVAILIPALLWPVFLKLLKIQ